MLNGYHQSLPTRRKNQVLPAVFRSRQDLELCCSEQIQQPLDSSDVSRIDVPEAFCCSRHRQYALGATSIKKIERERGVMAQCWLGNVKLLTSHVHTTLGPSVLFIRSRM